MEYRGVVGERVVFLGQVQVWVLRTDRGFQVQEAVVEALRKDRQAELAVVGPAVESGLWRRDQNQFCFVEVWAEPGE